MLHEHSAKLEELDAVEQEKLLPELFGNNPAAARVKFRVKEVPERLEDALETTLRAYFVFVAVSIECYCSDIIDDVLEITGIVETNKQKQQYQPKRFFRLIAESTPEVVLGKQLFRTWDYLRLRRNCYAHNAGQLETEQLTAEQPTDLLVRAIREWGKGLNKFWRAQRTFTGELNFADMNVFNLTAEECLSVYAIARHLLDALEGEVVARFKDELVRFHERRIYKEQLDGPKDRIFGDREARLRSLVRYELSLTNEEFENYIPLLP
jgi:hypothetical protein